MTFLEALHMARPLIERGQVQYICTAMDTWLTEPELCNRVQDQLAPYSVYEDWVAANHPETCRQMRKVPGAFREGRLQWIDYMIQQEESRLDYTAASVKVSKIATRID